MHYIHGTIMMLLLTHASTVCVCTRELMHMHMHIPRSFHSSIPPNVDTQFFCGGGGGGVCVCVCVLGRGRGGGGLILPTSTTCFIRSI